MNAGNDDVVCSITADYSSTRASSSSCPSCKYAFDTRLDAGGTSGASCGDFTSATLFDSYSYTDFWFGTSSVKGWGWADAYTYSYAGTDYDFTNVVFMNYESEWILREFNWADGGIENVTGTRNSASWQSVIDDGAYYYYFYL